MHLAAKSDNLSSIPGIPVVEEENQLSQAVFWSTYMYLGMCVRTH